MENLNDRKYGSLLTRYLDGDLSRDEEIDALHQFAENESARDMLRFSLDMAGTLRHDPDSFSVPENFSDTVMEEIEKIEEMKADEISGLKLVRDNIKPLFLPRDFAFRPATLFLAAAIVLLVFTNLFNVAYNDNSMQPNSTNEAEFASDNSENVVWMRFVYIDDEASELAVAGSFSNWEPIEMDMQKMGDKTVWSGLVPVERGEQRYMFIRNGDEWIPDPLAEIQRDDGFGNKNAVVYL